MRRSAIVVIVATSSCLGRDEPETPDLAGRCARARRCQRSKTKGRRLSMQRIGGHSKAWVLLACVSLAGLATAMAASGAASKKNEIKFDMVPSTAAATCLAHATGHVVDHSKGAVEELKVKFSGLPANTGFDFFVIQSANAPFGLSWYQGDIETNKDGKAHGKFVGRFNIETFIVAPGSTAAPTPHAQDARARTRQ